MNKELARKILNLLDSPTQVQTLSEFAEQEIARHYTTLEGCGDMISTAREQGAISALKQLKKLRETAAQVVENEARNPAPSSR